MPECIELERTGTVAIVLERINIKIAIKLKTMAIELMVMHIEKLKSMFSKGFKDIIFD